MSDLLEVYMIRMWHNDARCTNKKPGAEGPTRELPPHFTYIVAKT